MEQRLAASWEKKSAGESYSHKIELQTNYKLLSEEQRLKTTLERQGEL